MAADADGEFPEVVGVGEGLPRNDAFGVSSAPATRSREWRRHAQEVQLRWLACVAFLSWFSYALCQSASLPALVADIAGSDAQANRAITSFGVGMGVAATLVIQAVVARMDGHGRKLPLLVTTGGMALPPLVVLVCVSLLGQPLWVTVVALSLTGFVTNWPTIIATVSTVVADHAPRNAGRSYLFALFETVTFAALVTGPALGGWLAGSGGDTAPFWLSALAGIGAAAVGALTVEETLPKAQGLAAGETASAAPSCTRRTGCRCGGVELPGWLFARSSPLGAWDALARRGRTRGRLALALAIGWLARGGTVNVQVLTMSARGWSKSAIGDTFTLGNFTAALAMVGLTRAARSGGVSERALMILGFATAAAGLALQGLAATRAFGAGKASDAALVVGLGVQHLGSVYQPVGRSMISRLCEESHREQGEVMGAIATLEMLLWWLPMLYTEQLYAALGTAALFLAACLYICAASVAVVLIGREDTPGRYVQISQLSAADTTDARAVEVRATDSAAPVDALFVRDDDRTDSATATGPVQAEGASVV